MSKKYILNNVGRYTEEMHFLAPLDKENDTKKIKCNCYMINIFTPQHTSIADNMDIDTKYTVMKLLIDKINTYIENSDTIIDLYKYLYNGDFTYDFLNKYLQDFVNDEQLLSQFNGIIENNFDKFFTNIINDIFIDTGLIFTDIKDFLIKPISNEITKQFDKMIQNYLAKDNITTNTDLFIDTLDIAIKIYSEEISTMHNVIHSIIGNYIVPIKNNIFTYIPPIEIIRIIFRRKNEIITALNSPDVELFLEGLSPDKFIDITYKQCMQQLNLEKNKIVKHIINTNKITNNLRDYLNFQHKINIITSLMQNRRNYIKNPELMNLVNQNTFNSKYFERDEKIQNIIYTTNEIIVKYLNISINIYSPGIFIVNYQFDNLNLSDKLLLKTGVYETSSVDDFKYKLDDLTNEQIQEYNPATYVNMKELMQNATPNDIVISFCDYYIDKQNLKYI